MNHNPRARWIALLIAFATVSPCIGETVGMASEEEYLVHHELCICSGNQVMIVNVTDSCGDDDCEGCCA